jgi:Tfp pilus assembly protein PilX
MKQKVYAIGARKQRGAVMVVALIMLAVMTLFVVSMLKTSVIELKIGGVSHVVAVNFSNAEVAINSFITANNGIFAPGFLGTTVINVPPAVQGGTVTLTATQLKCGDAGFINTQFNALRAVQFDLNATATGTLGGTVSLHQGVQTLAPSNSC